MKYFDFVLATRLRGDAPAGEEAESVGTESAREVGRRGEDPEEDPRNRVITCAPVRRRDDDDELRERLTPLQYAVTQENGTEMAFFNDFWDLMDPGIYVDVVSGEPLFSSLDKYHAGCGWPSFTRPLEPENIVTRLDYEFLIERVEVRSKEADSHLGHLFDDGPPPTGMRYCVNSAALRFVPATELEDEGYERYLHLFESLVEES